MLVELEFPNDDLVGRELKFKVAMQSTETYFMLGCTYPDILAIGDPRAQSFYKQMYNSIAMQNEKRQYLGKLSQKFEDPNDNTVGQYLDLETQKSTAPAQQPTKGKTPTLDEAEPNSNQRVDSSGNQI